MPSSHLALHAVARVATRVLAKLSLLSQGKVVKRRLMKVVCCADGETPFWKITPYFSPFAVGDHPTRRSLLAVGFCYLLWLFFGQSADPQS